MLKTPRWGTRYKKEALLLLPYAMNLKNFLKDLYKISQGTCGAHFWFKSMIQWDIDLWAVVTSNLLYQTIWGKHWSFLLYGSWPKQLGKNANNVEKLVLPSHVPPMSSQGSLCIPSSLLLDLYYCNDLFNCLSPQNLSSHDCVLFITVTPLPGTEEEMTNHVYEMNKQMNEEQKTSFLEQLILSCLK